MTYGYFIEKVIIDDEIVKEFTVVREITYAIRIPCIILSFGLGYGLLGAARTSSISELVAIADDKLGKEKVDNILQNNY